MCTFFDTEVVLLNALRNDHNNTGVGYHDIRRYCTEVKKTLFADSSKDVKCVSFQISKRELEENVREYPSLFQSHMGRYYKGAGYDPDIFNRRNSASINSVLRQAALNYTVE